MSAVAVVKGNKPIEMVAQAMETVGATNVFSIGDRVLVKPNYVHDRRRAAAFAGYGDYRPPSLFFENSLLWGEA